MFCIVLFSWSISLLVSSLDSLIILFNWPNILLPTFFFLSLPNALLNFFHLTCYHLKKIGNEGLGLPTPFWSHIDHLFGSWEILEHFVGLSSHVSIWLFCVESCRLVEAERSVSNMEISLITVYFLVNMGNYWPFPVSQYPTSSICLRWEVAACLAQYCFFHNGPQ